MKHAALLGVLLLACSKGPTPAPTPASSTSSGVSSAVSASAAASAEPAPLPPPSPEAACRALRVEGDAKLGAAPLASGALLDGSEWVTLAQGASVTLKHVTSGREISLIGPALFRACQRGREQVLLARGNVQGGGGMGVRPGAEVLLATPIALVHYADADFSLALDDKRLSVQVRAGQVELDGTAKPVKSPLHGKDKLTLPLGRPDAVRLMASCQEAAQGAQASAARVAAPGSTEPLGKRAQAHVQARELARTRCAIAAASIGLVADPGLSAGLWAEAARAEDLWTAIPHLVRGKPSEK